MTSSFNTHSLLSVKSELDRSLSSVSRELEEAFSSGQDKQHLNTALAELHRMLGVVQMLGLRGLAVFCSELETHLQELSTSSSNASVMRQEAIHRALFGLTHYLNALCEGASNATLRLFLEYQDLLQARGIEMAFEVDLFFPDLQVELPPSILAEPQLPDPIASIKTARVQYQQGLLKWLRQDNPKDALSNMMGAIRVVLQCAPQDRSRAFWWVAGGLLNCVFHDGVPPELDLKKTISRIDQRMRALLDNSKYDEVSALSEMLYLVARSHTVSDTVETIKQTYNLDAYLPEESPLPQSKTTALLDNMRSQLSVADTTWEHCVVDDAAACKRFAEQAEQLYLLSEQLDRNTLQFLGKQIHTTAVHSDDPERAQRIANDMAMALLLLHGGIEHYQHIGANFHEQARILSMRMQAGMMRMPQDENKLASLVSLYCEMEQHEVIGPLAIEMQSNLQLVEQSLNAYFGNTSKRGELSQVGRLLSQVQGGLHILSLDAAEGLIAKLRQLAGRYHQGETPSSAEMTAVASAMSLLDDYIRGLTPGQKPPTAALAASLQELTDVSSNAARNEPSGFNKETTQAGVSIRSGEENAELLEVFLEEAQEVLETLRSNLEVARIHLDSREPWLTMRRAFHTLKGSGRMVGLTELGEVAWAIERAMNKWLGDNTAVSPALLEMVGDAEVLFQYWVDMLKSGATTAQVITAPLLSLAERVEQGIATPQPAETLIDLEPSIAAEPAHAQITEQGIEFPSLLETINVQDTPIAADSAGPAHAPSAQITEQGLELPSFLESINVQDAPITADSAGPAHAQLTQIAEQGLEFPSLLETINVQDTSIAADSAESAHTQLAQITEQELELPSFLETINVQPPPIAADSAEPAHAQLAEQEVESPLSLEITNVQDISLVKDSSASARMQSADNYELATITERDEEANVQIGAISIAPALFRIAVEEASKLVLTLQTLSAELQADSNASVSYDFMRAAHTIAGINRTMGFASIADLASALELWLEVRINKHGAVNKSDFALLDEAISRLNEMTVALQERNEPQAHPALVERLQAEKELQVVAEEITTPDTSSFFDQVPDIAIRDAVVVPESDARDAELPEVEEHGTAPKHRTVHDELDEQLLPIFLEEAQDLYPQIGTSLRNWRDDSGNAQSGQNLLRNLHTLKGSARMAGAMRLGELTHLVEDRISQAVSTNTLDSSLWTELDSYLDRIAHAIEELQNPQSSTLMPDAATATIEQETATPIAATPAALDTAAERSVQASMLRVRSDIVDRLVNEAGEISVARSRVETELREFKSSVVELTESVNRLRHQLREIEIHAEGQMQARTAVSGESAEKFDPLEFDRFTRFQELTRFMNESVHDVQTVQHSLLKNLDESVAALSAQSLLNRDLQQGLMSIRMVPFSSVRERLYRVVRQTGKELNKRVNLELLGTDIELDRSVLEKMTAPFEHLLRNAIAHGLESPELREQNGKDPIGEIQLSLKQESNEVVFVCSDDGAGLNLPAIRQKALSDGTIHADEEISDEQLMQLIFKAGLSTAREISEISGRGVGLDVVSSEITALGGRVDVTSEAGRGVRFTIHLPLTLAVTKTLMVRAGQITYALPASIVSRVEQLKPSELEALYKQQYFDWQGTRYPMFYLPRLLGNEHAEVTTQPHNPVLLLKSGEHQIALHVDELLGNREAVVKNIGPQLARVAGIAGATVSGSGAVILIINPVAFTQRIAVTRQIEHVIAAETVRSVPLIMVVDDSLTVRKITTRLLERAGYQVVTAKDGVDALEQLVEITPSVMLLDVEMPRMDGFELAKRLRQDSKTKNLPILMITSRTADKHRDYALELGVNEYLGKPFQEEELLQHIARYVSLQS